MQANQRGQGEQGVRVGRQISLSLILGATTANPLRQANRPAEGSVIGRIARRHTGHGSWVPMAGSAGSLPLLPQRLALLHPEKARIGGIIILHGARSGAGIDITAVPLAGQDTAGQQQQQRQQKLHGWTVNGTSWV